MKHKGNTLAEYGLIGTVVLIAVIVLVLLAGQNLEKALRGLKGDMGKSVAGAKNYAQLVASEKKAAAGQGAGIVGLMQICTSGKNSSKKTCVSLPENAAMKAIATTGGLGNNLTQAQFAEVLNSTLNELEWEDKVNVVALAVKDLASTGHEISKAEKDLQLICTSGSVCDSGLNNVSGDSEEGAMVLTKGSEIQSKSADFADKKEVLDTMLTVAPSALSDDDKQVIDVKSSVIVETAAKKDASSVDDIKNGKSADTISAGAGSICKTVDPGDCKH